MTSICVIPARGGSRRIPQKNVKLFLGRPIIAYAITTAQTSGLFDQIYVSTDDPFIMHVISQYGAEPLLRPPELAINEVGTQEVMRHALQLLRFTTGEHCCLYATTPLLQISDLGEGWWARRRQRMAYSLAVNEQNEDIGQYYWGEAQAWLARVPIRHDTTALVPTDAIDINTPDDWAMAERIYAERYGEPTIPQLKARP